MLWDFPLRSLVSLRDRMIQFKLVHRACITPHRLQKINSVCSAKCWRYGASRGDFKHIFWTCPYIAIFWGEVVYLLNTITSAPIPVSMSVCLLGLVEATVRTVSDRVFLIQCYSMQEKPLQRTGRNLALLHFYIVNNW